MAQKMSCLFPVVFTQKGVTQRTKPPEQDGINEAGERSPAAGISGFGPVTATAVGTRGWPGGMRMPPGSGGLCLRCGAGAAAPLVLCIPIAGSCGWGVCVCLFL